MREPHSHDFILRFRLPGDAPDPESHLEALDASGCDDAAAGIGRHGWIALAFSREAPSIEAAIATAIRDVLNAIPHAMLIEVDTVERAAIVRIHSSDGIV